MTKIKNFIYRIKHKEYLYITKRILYIFLPHIPSIFYIHNRFIYNLFITPLWTQYLKIPQNYTYMLLGSHGVGFSAFVKFFEIIGANPMPLKNMFSSIDFVLLIRKHSKINHGKIYGLTFDKSYKDYIRINILKKFKNKVPAFCLVRDPISIIKTHTHYCILPIIIKAYKEKKILIDNGGGWRIIDNEILNLINTNIYNTIKFLIKEIDKSYITPFFCFTSIQQSLKHTIDKIYYIDMEEIKNTTETYHTMMKIANILNIDTEHIKKSQFNINYSGINIINNLFPYEIEIDGLKLQVFLKNKQKYQETDYSVTSKLDVICFNQKNKLNKYIIDKSITKAKNSYIKIDSFIKEYGLEQIVLEALKNNIELSLQLNKILEYEITNLKTTSPNILNNWKFYKQFIRNINDKSHKKES